MIEVRNLVKRYGDVLAVDDISFDVGDGEVVGFLGPNGAGKSTTLKILTCYQPATRGSVRVAGFDVLTQSLEVRTRLGYLPESVPVYPDMRVEEYLRFRGLLKGVSRRDIGRRVEAALERCQCREMRRRMIGGLSKGYRQRVGLADAIVHDPPLLVLDEPTSGLDPNQRLEVRRLIQDLGKDKTVILSSHILAEVEAVAEKVIIIHRGHVVARGAPSDIVRELGGWNRIRVEVKADAAAVEGACKGIDGIGAIRVEPLTDGFVEAEFDTTATHDVRSEIARRLIEHGLALREMTRPGLSLEEIFRRLTTSASKEDAA
ncbi:MAG: ATP-binding cassette domain-containing protein [Planctomycetes bacterium]|nr:ATP-binding cassette domain-containing protein [Planctomycetota bacterium]MCC7170828.1 ATP-binding cassette domain-containing protein [Planctomycetota bacterium]